MNAPKLSGPAQVSGPIPPAPAVELRGISKVYAGRKSMANNNISLALMKGEILCIAGENGAGKTTLMNILCGLTPPSAGEIFISGRQVRIDSPAAAGKLGIGMVHQHFMLFPEYTAAENIAMGMEPTRRGIFYDRKRAEAEAAEIIRAHGFSIEAGRQVKNLSVGEMQQVEICRILRRNADIIILDEPTSVLTEQEINSLFNTLRVLARSGKSLILITHKLREIKRISSRVAVLRRGELAGVRDTAEIDEYGIARMMSGDAAAPNPSGGGDVSRSRDKKKTGPSNTSVSDEAGMSNNDADKGGEIPNGPVIAFEKVSIRRRGQERPLLEEVSFSAGAGEIIGFAGVGGNGLGVLEAALGGFLHPQSGRILHRGKDISRLNIRRLRNEGLAFVPADRLRVGSAPGVRLDENMIIDRRAEFFRLGMVKRRAVADFSRNLIRRYRIAGRDSDPASALSGGNIQKMILAREIDQFRDYIVFSEPAWGLDAAASAFVYGEIKALRGRGAAIILISTNLDEILSLADRIMVMYRGKIAGEFRSDSGADIANIKEEIGACMMGLKRGEP
jgi:simple sugar transport system ATP-binding protein